jgi:catechol 2,3-dioxygenase-like lactoylglutathione lyase family enzyme
MPINSVGTVCVFVENQERAKKFHTERLGFELRTDQQRVLDGFWLREVCPNPPAML